MFRKVLDTLGPSPASGNSGSSGGSSASTPTGTPVGTPNLARRHSDSPGLLRTFAPVSRLSPERQSLAPPAPSTGPAPVSGAPAPRLDEPGPRSPMKKTKMAMPTPWSREATCHTTGNQVPPHHPAIQPVRDAVAAASVTRERPGLLARHHPLPLKSGQGAVRSFAGDLAGLRVALAGLPPATALS